MAAAKKTTVETIELKKPVLETATLQIVSTSPMVQHRWSEKAKRMILDKEMGITKGIKKHPIKNPVIDFINTMYWMSEKPEFEEDADGNYKASPEEAMDAFNQAMENGATFGIPVTAIKQAAISAAYRGGYSKDKVSLQGSFFVKGIGDEQLVPIVISEAPHMREDMVRVGMGAADIRHRGQFDSWSATLEITYNKNGSMKFGDIANMIMLGGFSVGIMEMRPEKGGSYGTFTVA